MKIKEILKNTLARDILGNIIYLILMIIYFIYFNTQVITLEAEAIIAYIEISSMTFLAIAIIMFEMGYRNNKAKIILNGIEFLVLAIFTLFIKHTPKVLEQTMTEYIMIGAYLTIAYYILKSAVQYTIKKQNELKSLSDIKEIVKEEPLKKATKRKNKKEEENENGK